MKKTLLPIVLLAALAVVGCQKPDSKNTAEVKVFIATTEEYIVDATDAETKTVLESGGCVLWKRGDQVGIFAGSTINEHYQVTDASDGRTAASLYQVTSPGFVAGGEIANNVAFYPYAETAELSKNASGYIIRDIALPATQNYAESSFGNGAFPMVAVTSSESDHNLKFKNVLGGLKLQLKGTAKIASISVTGNNNEKLCGAAVIAASTNAAPSIALSDATAKTVTLDCGDGIQLSASTATAFIIALPPMTMTGGFTITITDTDGGQKEIKSTKSQTITRSSLLAMPAVTVNAATSVPADAVDLGLPSGRKWASCNVGASAPEEYGDYFAWGATAPQESNYYYWDTYPFRTSGDSWDTVKFSKYNTSSDYGLIDNNTELDSEDDAAAVNWGGSWRMPTDAEWTELRTECTWTWTTQNGVNGRLVTGPNGNSIFLPAAGFRYNTYLDDAGSFGDYWSSSLNSGIPYSAWLVDFLSSGVYWYDRNRYSGHSVRAVSE